MRRWKHWQSDLKLSRKTNRMLRQPSARTKLPDGVNDLCLRLAGYPAPLSVQQASAQDMEQILGYRAHPIQRPFGLA